MTWRANTAIALLLVSLSACRERHEAAPARPTQKKAVEAPSTAVSAPVTRPARLAGSWYSADPGKLKKELDALFVAAKADPAVTGHGRLVGVIAPHAGYSYSGRTAASAYRLLRQQRPKRVFVLGPSHYARLRGVALVKGSQFATPLGPLSIDVSARARLAKNRLFVDAPEVDAREHSVEMQMPFIRYIAPNAKVVPLIAGQLTLDEIEQVAQAIRRQMGPGDVFVASSDFTHYGPRYGYVPFREQVPWRLEQLDRTAWRYIAAGDISAFWRFKHRTEDTICGFYPISVLMAIVGPHAEAHLVRYDSSGKVTGDYENSVGYVAAAFYVQDSRSQIPTVAPLLNAAQQHAALQMARETIRLHFDGKRYDPRGAGIDLGGQLSQPRGVFVTLKQRDSGQLRGCIGSVQTKEPLYAGIVDNALRAAFEDPRFAPLTRQEFRRVTVEVTVLTPPHRVAGTEAVTIGRDGVILARDGHQALFLPQVAVEQGWGLRRTLQALSRKAGLGVDGWRGAGLYTFRGQVYGEEQEHL